ncbi:MAG: MFS transporter [Jatrophihabitans sp.]|nr:MAG: MFS transporter [Jatrophihabitans sp.]
MRTAVTSVGAVLDDVQHGLHTSAAVAGLLTTLPVLCFAALGSITPALGRRYGLHRLLVASIVVMTAGMLARVFVGSAAAFLLLSIPALAGGAAANVLLPPLVKLHFPHRIGTMTAIYTTALAVGTTAAAGLTVPLGSVGDGWRTGLGSWALLSALAVLPWLPTLRHDRPADRDRDRIGARHLLRSPTAWMLTIFFGFQSAQAYIAFGWFATFLRDHGQAADTAGAMVAVLAAVTIPTSMVVPRIPARHHRGTILALAGCYVVAYAGMAVAPAGGAWLWMVLTGIGSSSFPLALTMIGLRSRSADVTTSLSAFTQSIGYVLAGSGPLLFGVLHSASGSWGLPLALLFAMTAIMTVAGMLAGRPRYVEDEIGAGLTAAAAAR